MGHVGISFPSDVIPNTRPLQAPNCHPYKHLKVNNDIYKFSFYPRTIVLWNNTLFNMDSLDTVPLNQML